MFSDLAILDSWIYKVVDRPNPDRKTLEDIYALIEELDDANEKLVLYGTLNGLTLDDLAERMYNYQGENGEKIDMNIAIDDARTMYENGADIKDIINYIIDFFDLNIKKENDCKKIAFILEYAKEGKNIEFEAVNMSKMGVKKIYDRAVAKIKRKWDNDRY